MTSKQHTDVIIIGGSYAGLAAAMALGRSLRTVLIIDSGKPCNIQTPHSHNFITHDGATPAAIHEAAKAQVLQYDTVSFREDTAINAVPHENGFMITTAAGKTFTASKLLFATGVKDIMPPMKGFADCWGISVLHCPYCHGYEVKGERIALMANGDMGFELVRLIHNWSKNLVLFTNGASTLTAEQAKKIDQYGIAVIEGEIDLLEHEAGYIRNIVLKDGTKHKVTAAFARPAFQQHSDLPAQLGCELTEQGYLKTDDLNRTVVPGVYVAGDNTTMMRSVASAVAAGTRAGAFINKELIDEQF